jgi:hypothetical protein
MRILGQIAMSAERSPTPTEVSTTDSPQYGYSASYMPCRKCGEGSLVYDESLGGTVCRCCGEPDE